MSIVTQVQTLLNDVGVFWPLAQVLDAINEAQLWAYGISKWQRSSWALTLVTGLDLLTLPTDVLIPGWIETAIPTGTGGTSTARGFPTTHRELETASQGWRGEALGAPHYFVIWDAFTIRLFPRPDQAYTYTLRGVGFPAEVVDTTTDLAGPAQYVLGVQNAAVALLLEATRPDLAEVYRQTADDQLLTLKKRLRNQQSHNIRRLVPQGLAGSTARGGLFTLNQGGIVRTLPTYYPVEG